MIQVRQGSLYIRSVIKRYTPNPLRQFNYRKIALSLHEPITCWCKYAYQIKDPNLIHLSIAGSYAKGTSILHATDIDLFISLPHIENISLKEMYDRLAAFLDLLGLQTIKQNVSIRVVSRDVKIDVVPAMRIPKNLLNHWLYLR